MSRDNRATPEEFRAIFEENRVGAKIFDELIARFGELPAKSEGIDRVLDQFQYTGCREIIEFITLRINQANGFRSHGEIIDLNEEEPGNG